MYTVIHGNTAELRVHVIAAVYAADCICVYTEHVACRIYTPEQFWESLAILLVVCTV